MKLRELFYMLGFKPAIIKYGSEVRSFDLTGIGPVQYAQWLHPGESDKEITVEQVEALKRFAGDGDFCIDIGAHSGDTTIPMALAVGKSGLVLALEPNRYVFEILKKNTQLNPEKTNIVPLMVAATAQDGAMEFEYSDSGFCNGGFHEGISRFKHGHAFKLKVTGINLSNRLRAEFSDRLPKLKLIKIDTEGYDLSVLKSLTYIIDEFRPYIKTEIYKHTTTDYRNELFRFFDSRSYGVYLGEDATNLQGERLTIDSMNSWKHFDIFCVPE